MSGAPFPLLRRFKRFMVLAKQVIHATQTPEMAEEARKAAVKVVVSMEAAQPKGLASVTWCLMQIGMSEGGSGKHPQFRVTVFQKRQ